MRPMEISRYRNTLGQIRAADNMAGRSATRHLERCKPVLICGIWCTPNLKDMCGTRPFLGGSERRIGVHTRPAFPEMSTAPSAFPLLGAPQAPGDEPNTPKEVKAWRKGPMRPKEISRYRDTLGQTRTADYTAGWSATRHLERCRTRLICGICCSPHPTGKCGTRPFYGGSKRRAVAHTPPAFAKNAWGPVGIPLIRGASGAGRLT